MLVAKVDHVIQNKDYDEIEVMFQLYTVIRQEHQLLGNDFNFNLLVDTPQVIYAQLAKEKNLTNPELNRLQEVRDRRRDLEKAMNVGELRQLK